MNDVATLKQNSIYKNRWWTGSSLCAIVYQPLLYYLPSKNDSGFQVDFMDTHTQFFFNHTKEIASVIILEVSSKNVHWTNVSPGEVEV